MQFLFFVLKRAQTGHIRFSVAFFSISLRMTYPEHPSSVVSKSKHPPARFSELGDVHIFFYAA